MSSSIEGEQPLIRRYQGKQHITFVFDTTGHYSTPEASSHPTILLTRHDLMVGYEGQVQKQSWQDYGAFSISPKTVQAAERLIRMLYFPVSYSLLLMYTLLAKFLTAVFLTGFAVVAATRYSVKLLFRNAFAIALYSLTPAIVIGLAVTVTGLDISYFHIIYLAIAAIYTYMGAQRCVAPVE